MNIGSSKLLQRGSLVWIDFEDLVVATDLEGILDHGTESTESQAPLARLDLTQEFHQVGQHGAGDEMGIGKVDEDPRLLPGLDQVEQLLAHCLDLIPLEHGHGLFETDD